jgi:hypothetical protein
MPMNAPVGHTSADGLWGLPLGSGRSPPPPGSCAGLGLEPIVPKGRFHCVRRYWILRGEPQRCWGRAPCRRAARHQAARHAGGQFRRQVVRTTRSHPHAAGFGRLACAPAPSSRATYIPDEPIAEVLRRCGARTSRRTLRGARKLDTTVSANAPSNVHFTGFLEEDTQWGRLRSADAIVRPVAQGRLPGVRRLRKRCHSPSPVLSNNAASAN